MTNFDYLTDLSNSDFRTLFGSLATTKNKAGAKLRTALTTEHTRRQRAAFAALVSPAATPTVRVIPARDPSEAPTFVGPRPAPAPAPAPVPVTDDLTVAPSAAPTDGALRASVKLANGDTVSLWRASADPRRAPICFRVIPGPNAVIGKRGTAVPAPESIAALRALFRKVTGRDLKYRKGRKGPRYNGSLDGAQWGAVSAALTRC